MTCLEQRFLRENHRFMSSPGSDPGSDSVSDPGSDPGSDPESDSPFSRQRSPQGFPANATLTLTAPHPHTINQLARAFLIFMGERGDLIGP